MRDVEEYGFGTGETDWDEEHKRAQESGEVFEGGRWSDL